MATAKPTETFVGEPAFRTEPPWYVCTVKTERPLPHRVGHGSVSYRLTIDAENGRAYAQLASDADRLAFMQAHADEVRRSAEPDSTFYHDHDAGKRYILYKGTPEYEGLQALSQADGRLWWPEGTPEAEAVVAYFKTHAHEVRNVPARLA
ncbi:hypothetical protein SPI_01465 [Niveomyces insectorum RCEF 264]|uniref:Uncharacterized protein n=1 Tax=Niveomyces insectorum RCEF 264 TaxID=1081102 RepID=A0A167YZM8_9HYPO|nr:hypothetical protein SPI_01465 [Niveomyces insectorum RCEF 264]